jgi:hypothetical protein
MPSNDDQEYRVGSYKQGPGSRPSHPRQAVGHRDPDQLARTRLLELLDLHNNNSFNSATETIKSHGHAFLALLRLCVLPGGFFEE